MRLFCITLILMIFFSCSEEKIDGITNLNDYNKYLITGHNETYKNAFNEVVFWSKRLKADSSGIGDLGPLANAYTTLFEATGETRFLKAPRSYIIKQLNCLPIKKTLT